MLDKMDKVLFGLMFLAFIIGTILAVSGKLAWVG